MPYQEYLKKAVEFANSGHHEEAIKFYRKAADAKWHSYTALQGWAGSLTWLSKFKQALQIQIRSAACFPDYSPDYFVLKTRIKTNIINSGNTDLLDYTIECLNVLTRILKFNFYANDFLAEMLVLNGQLDQAKQKKYFATICNAAFSKGRDLDIFDQKNGKLPDFFVIGPQKTATTALYAYLMNSPHIYPSINKELFFFNGPSFENGLDWYRCHFPKLLDEQIITGEATATYFNAPPLVAKRIKSAVPKAKLIFTFRNPSKRAISSFFMEKRHGREPNSLIDVISSEIKFLRDNPLKEGGHPDGFFDTGHKGYVLYGLYEHYLQNFKKQFESDQIMIIQSEQLRDVNSVMPKIAKFLSVDFPLMDPEKEVNVGEYEKNEEYERAIQLLDEFYFDFKNYVGDLNYV